MGWFASLVCLLCVPRVFPQPACRWFGSAEATGLFGSAGLVVKEQRSLKTRTIYVSLGYTSIRDTHQMHGILEQLPAHPSAWRITHSGV
jgi:hypothetical protein